jgi:hypothetical protein
MLYVDSQILFRLGLKKGMLLGLQVLLGLESVGSY